MIKLIDIVKESVPGQPGFKLPYTLYNDKGKTSFSIKMKISVSNEYSDGDRLSQSDILKLLKDGDVTISKGVGDLYLTRVKDDVRIAKIEYIIEL